MCLACSISRSALDNGRPQMPELYTSIRKFVGATVIAAVVLLATVGFAPVEAGVHVWRTAVFFVSMGLLDNFLTAYGRERKSFFVFTLAAAASAPGWPVIVATGLGMLVREVIVRGGFLKAVFNVAQEMVATSLATLVFLAWKVSGVLSLLAAVLAGSIAYLVANAILVGGVIAVSQGRSPFRSRVRMSRDMLLYGTLGALLVALLALVYVRFGVAWTLGASVVMIGVRREFIVKWRAERAHEENLYLMVRSIEARDPYTSGHALRVSRYARLIARAAHLEEAMVEQAAQVAMLQNIGTVHEEFAPILRKVGRLTETEYSIVKSHPERGAALVAGVDRLASIASSIRSHHESWDGRGYPDGLSGQAIPLLARIVALADTIDAMTSNRPYRGGLSADLVRKEIVREAGRQFDPALVDAITAHPWWSRMVEEIERSKPVESEVEESTQESEIVTFDLEFSQMLASPPSVMPYDLLSTAPRIAPRPVPLRRYAVPSLTKSGERRIATPELVAFGLKIRMYAVNEDRALERAARVLGRNAALLDGLIMHPLGLGVTSLPDFTVDRLAFASIERRDVVILRFENSTVPLERLEREEIGFLAVYESEAALGIDAEITGSGKNFLEVSLRDPAVLLDPRDASVLPEELQSERHITLFILGRAKV